MNDLMNDPKVWELTELCHNLSLLSKDELKFVKSELNKYLRIKKVESKNSKIEFHQQMIEQKQAQFEQLWFQQARNSIALEKIKNANSILQQTYNTFSDSIIWLYVRNLENDKCKFCEKIRYEVYILLPNIQEVVCPKCHMSFSNVHKTHFLNQISIEYDLLNLI